MTVRRDSGRGENLALPWHPTKRRIVRSSFERGSGERKQGRHESLNSETDTRGRALIRVPRVPPNSRWNSQAPGDLRLGGPPEEGVGEQEEPVDASEEREAIAAQNQRCPGSGTRAEESGGGLSLGLHALLAKASGSSSPEPGRRDAATTGRVGKTRRL